jgi:hypothetical protein
MSSPKRFVALACLALGLLLCVPTLTRADAVTDWNAIAITTIAAQASHPGATSFLDSAMVQAAVYDAVESINHRFRPYAISVPGASGSTAAAVAKATRDVLAARFPALTASLEAQFQAYLTAHGLTDSDAGVSVGAQAAAAIIALRANDGSFPSPAPPPFTGGRAIGEWRPVDEFVILPGASTTSPLPFSPMLAPWLATVTPFTLTSPSQFRAVPPPAVTSHRYAEAFDEVKRMGRATGSERTDAQTDLANFWYSNYLILWNATLRSIAGAHLSSIDDSARLFALANLAMADSLITAWDTKRHYVFWRPITAIHEADIDGNPWTTADPDWKPLANTPNYPDYTSGANNVTGSITRILKLFFHTDEMHFTVATTYPPAIQRTRDYERFSDAADDVVNARIWEGIHFRFADVQARKQGRHVAQWVFAHFLRPVDADDHDDHDDSDDE